MLFRGIHPFQGDQTSIQHSGWGYSKILYGHKIKHFVLFFLPFLNDAWWSVGFFGRHCVFESLISENSQLMIPMSFSQAVTASPSFSVMLARFRLSPPSPSCSVFPYPYLHGSSSATIFPAYWLWWLELLARVCYLTTWKSTVPVTDWEMNYSLPSPGHWSRWIKLPSPAHSLVHTPDPSPSWELSLSLYTLLGAFEKDHRRGLQACGCLISLIT